MAGVNALNSPNPYRSLFIDGNIMLVDALELYTNTAAPLTKPFSAKFYSTLRDIVRSEAGKTYDIITGSPPPVAEDVGSWYGDFMNGVKTEVNERLPEVDKVDALPSDPFPPPIKVTPAVDFGSDESDIIELRPLGSNPDLPYDTFADAGDGDDSITGSGARDYIIAGDGNDTVKAGGGNDTLVAGSGAGDDFYDGGSDLDTIKFTSTKQGVLVDLISGTALGSETGSDTLVAIENVIGGSGNDTLRGDALDNMLDGEAGNDLIEPGAGNDTVVGGAGADVFAGTLADLNDDVVSDFDFDDALLFRSVILSASNVRFIAGTTTLEIDTNGDGTADSKLNLSRDFAQGGSTLSVVATGNDTMIRIVAPPVTPTTPSDQGGESGSPTGQTPDDGTGQSTSPPPTEIDPSRRGYVHDGVTERVIQMDHYTGPVAWLKNQYLGISTGEAVIGSESADFINLLGGDDAAEGRAGDDVLDGGTGSNFLTGGTETDTFFVDGRNTGITWSTVTDFEPDEWATAWGWRPEVSKLTWADMDGANGFKGATAHMDMDGNGTIDISMTFTGKAVGSVITMPGQVNGDTYLAFRLA